MLEKIQEDANGIHSIRERYMNSASATPSTVFATILNLSTHHLEKLTPGRQVFYEKLKQEIISKLDIIISARIFLPVRKKKLKSNYK